MRTTATLALPIVMGAGFACSGQELPRSLFRTLPATPAVFSQAELLRPSSVRSVQLLAELAAARLRAPAPPEHHAPATLPAALHEAPAAPESHWLGALAKEVVVFAEPSASARRLGYLRSGARVQRSAAPVSHAGCRGGWYRVVPEGFVCVGSRATLDLEHPLLQLALAQPSRDDGLPYAYGRSRLPAPPIYRSVPAEAAGGPAELGAWRGVALQPVPDLLRAPPSLDVIKEPSVPKSAFAFVSFVEAGGRAYGVTTDLELVPLGGVTPIAPSSLHGLVLDADATLPVAFVMRARTFLYAGDAHRGLRPLRPLERREALAVSDRKLKLDGVTWLETRSGDWLRADAVRIVPRRDDIAGRSGKWIDVSIATQTLVAYEDDRPVFATLVSTGEGGLGDPEKTHATVQGRFRIHTKHVTATMDSDELGDVYDLRDVPYVQYFTQGYALHAAYWHDGFGTPRSHGCVNLSPSDARFLFHWTDPPVPRGWHTALAREPGTLIEIHP